MNIKKSHLPLFTFKSSNPRCIDLLLTDRGRKFQQTTAVETGLSDFHKMVVIVIVGWFDKQKPNVVNYRDYRNFRVQYFDRIFRETLLTLMYNV